MAAAAAEAVEVMTIISINMTTIISVATARAAFNGSGCGGGDKGC